MIPIKDENPTETFPFMTIGIIAANILIFLFQVSLGKEVGERLVFNYGFIPYELTSMRDIRISPAPFSISLFSSMFLHGGLLHLLGNMLYLWIFGNNIEDRVGHVKFVLFYMLCGIAAALVQTAMTPQSQIPMVGASGAISGVLGAYLVLYPMARVKTIVPVFFFIQIIYLPAFLFLGVWFLMQIAYSFAGGPVAWYAHIGGFIAGVALVLVFPKRRRTRMYYLRSL